MTFSATNFLFAIKNLVTGGGRNSNGEARNDSGFQKDTENLIGTSVLATSVTRITDGSGFPVLNAAAGITAVANVSFYVPRDYDEATDEIRIRFIALMGGATDVPTVTVTPKKRVTGAAATATIVASQTTAALSATPQQFELIWRGEGLKRNNLFEFTVTSAAHATDALQVQAIAITYRSTLVSYHEVDKTVTPTVRDIR